MNKNFSIEKQTSISSQLRPFIANLQHFIESYEGVILKISENLPEIENQIEDNITEARELLNFLFSSSRDKADFGVKKEINKFHTQLDAILADLTDMNSLDRQILTDLKNSIEISNNTVAEMENIYNISEGLKVYAINSIVNSQKAGDRGRGYQIISSEFIRLSEQIAAGTKEISAISGQIQKEIARFLDAVQNLEDYSNHHIHVISSDSRDILKKANSSIENFSQILNDLLNRIENSKSPTYQIMVELQKQDIIHQQLDHLVKNIDDILILLDKNSERLDLGYENTPEDEKHEVQSLYTLLIFLVDNTEMQINRISSDFLEMIGNLERLFLEMNTAISDINSDKTEFSDLVAEDSSGCSESGGVSNKASSVIGLIFNAPCTMIGEMRDNLHNLLNQKHNILNMFFNIENHIEAKKNHAQTFLPVIESIKNLLLLSRIEQARYNLDFSIAGAGSETGILHSSFDDLSGIIAEIENAHIQVIENFQRTRESFSIQETHYDIMMKQFLDSIDVLGRTKEVFMDHFNTIMSITGTLVNEIGTYNAFFNELRKLNDDIGINIRICAEIKKTVIERLEPFGGVMALEECHFRDIIYNNIVQKCTVAQERDTLMETFSDLQIEESNSSGITLF